MDVAVVFDGIESPGYNDAFLGLSADLAVALGTDDVDLVDLEQAPTSLVRAVLDRGVRLVGSPEAVERLRDRLIEDDQRPPLEQFNDALARIDEHLG